MKWFKFLESFLFVLCILKKDKSININMMCKLSLKSLIGLFRIDKGAKLNIQICSFQSRTPIYI